MTPPESLLPTTRKTDPPVPAQPPSEAEVRLSETPSDQALPLVEHLEELRRRILRALIAVAVFSVLGYHLSPALLRQMSEAAGPLVFLRPTEAFLARLKIAGVLGALFSAPVWLYQLWRFVGVALTLGERRVALGAVPFSTLLFMGGAAFAWFGVTPLGLKFLAGFGSDFLRPMLSVEAVLSFALWMSLGLGLLFQLPVVLAVLASWGLVTAADLRRHRRHAFLAILVLAAVLTPGPDVASQLLLAAPTYILFEVSVLLSAWLEPKKP